MKEQQKKNRSKAFLKKIFPYEASLLRTPSFDKTYSTQFVTHVVSPVSGSYEGRKNCIL